MSPLKLKAILGKIWKQYIASFIKTFSNPKGHHKSIIWLSLVNSKASRIFPISKNGQRRKYWLSTALLG